MSTAGLSTQPRPRWLAPCVVVLAALLLASLARYRLVEPAALTALCDAMPWDSPTCILRSLTVRAFAAERLGTLALAVSVLALLTRWRTLGLFALAAATAGLVLYSTRWAAPALLLAALALLPATAPGPAR
ncbi:MAG: hypothetical protein HZA62_06770 [Rhodocyclales bacterium]|nr:hypothetical protein [Rhodocyclales bacterium]